MKISPLNHFSKNISRPSTPFKPSFGVHLGEHFKEEIELISDKKAFSKKTKEFIKKIDNNPIFDDWVLDINNSGKYLTLFPIAALPYKKYLNAVPVVEINNKLIENALLEVSDIPSAEEKIIFAKEDISKQLEYIEIHGKKNIDTKSFLETLKTN